MVYGLGALEAQSTLNCFITRGTRGQWNFKHRVGSHTCIVLQILLLLCEHIGLTIAKVPVKVIFIRSIIIVVMATCFSRNPITTKKEIRSSIEQWYDD